jgi:protein-L-isoaspartate(D-aspartate) O-methyltransferase
MTTELNPKFACERLIRLLREKGITDDRVLDCFRKVPRHLFVDGAMYAQAYDDNALPIAFGQTISQPFIVALMTELLDIQKDEKILEIGTGSGFQTAILAQFSRRVYTIERHQGLGDIARKRLRDLGYINVVCKVSDGTQGWLQHSPFDKIIVTAGAPVVPQTLSDQLALNGRMVIPTGDRAHQELNVYIKTAEGLQKRSAGDVVFVPLVGEHGWEEIRD